MFPTSVWSKASEIYNVWRKFIKDQSDFSLVFVQTDVGNIIRIYELNIPSLNYLSLIRPMLHFAFLFECLEIVIGIIGWKIILDSWAETLFAISFVLHTWCLSIVENKHHDNRSSCLTSVRIILQFSLKPIFSCNWSYHPI